MYVCFSLSRVSSTGNSAQNKRGSVRFYVLECPELGGVDVCAFSMPVSVQYATGHGVYTTDDQVRTHS